MRAAFDRGCEHFKAHPDDTLTEVHRYASAAFPDAKEYALEFAHGYATARGKRDVHLRSAVRTRTSLPAGRVGSASVHCGKLGLEWGVPAAE